MIMITSIFKPLPFGFVNLHRMLQYFIGTVLILSSWHHYYSQVSALAVLISMTIYQSLILLLNYRTDILSNLKVAITLVFIDGVVTGLLLQFCGLHHALSIGIIGLFILVYVKAFSAISLAAILGVVGALFTSDMASLPSSDVTESVEVILLTLMIIFLVTFSYINNKYDRSLKDCLELQFKTNKTLKSHVVGLSKYLSPALSKSIIAGNRVKVEAKVKPLTIFFSDMQGFTKLSEELNTETLTWLINTYLQEMSEIIFRFGGTLDKVIGDSIMVFFGDPRSRGEKNDAIACVCMAISMNQAMECLKKRWIKAGIEQPPSLRMGINTGICKVGNFGTETKLDYTVMGSAVNLASYLESIARPDEIVISEHTYKLVKSRVHCTEKNLLDSQWFSKNLRVYSVNNININQD